MKMDFEAYHDESQIDGFWHGILLVPVSNKPQILDFLTQTRKNIGYTNPLSLKKVKRLGKIFDCTQSWISIGVSAMRSRTKGEPVGIYLGEKARGRKKYQLANEIIGMKFILFRSRQNHADLVGYKDHASKVETTFRMGLKGGLHFLGNEEEPINITKIHFDGYEHHQRNIDSTRVVGRIHGLRSYCTISEVDNLIDDRSSNHNQHEAQSYEDCQLLQLTDLMVGAFRTVLGTPTRDIHIKLSYPLKYLIERYEKCFARMQNSRWRNSFCMSECYLTNGKWEFDRLELKKDYIEHQLELPLFSKG